MPELISPTTELEAVNAILASVGESPVDALTGDFVDAQIAQSLLSDESRATQTIGWHFNTEAEYPLSPDVNGTLFLPQNTLRFVPDDGTDYVQRGNRVYDKSTRSYTSFTSNITATMVLALVFDELPEALRRYLVIRAGRRFQDQYQSDQILHSFQQRDELLAWSDFLNYDAEQAKYNVLSSSRTVARVRVTDNGADIGSVPNLINGISQQSPAMRLPSQAEASSNYYPTVTDGPTKRPPTDHLAVLAKLPDDTFTHFILRDETEKYVVAIQTNDTIRGWDFADAEKTVTNLGTAYLAGITSADDDLRALTLVDHTFIVNKRRTVRAGTATEPPYRYEALINVAAGHCGRIYRIFINSVR